MKLANPETRLTPREAEVMSYVVKGMTNSQIARKLIITTHTVKAHVASSLAKLHVKNRFEATMKLLNIDNE